MGTYTLVRQPMSGRLALINRMLCDLTSVHMSFVLCSVAMKHRGGRCALQLEVPELLVVSPALPRVSVFLVSKADREGQRNQGGVGYSLGRWWARESIGEGGHGSNSSCNVRSPCEQGAFSQRS